MFGTIVRSRIYSGPSILPEINNLIRPLSYRCLYHVPRHSRELDVISPNRCQTFYDSLERDSSRFYSVKKHGDYHTRPSHQCQLSNFPTFISSTPSTSSWTFSIRQRLTLTSQPLHPIPYLRTRPTQTSAVLSLVSCSKTSTFPLISSSKSISTRILRDNVLISKHLLVRHNSSNSKPPKNPVSPPNERESTVPSSDLSNPPKFALDTSESSDRTKSNRPITQLPNTQEEKQLDSSTTQSRTSHDRTKVEPTLGLFARLSKLVDLGSDQAPSTDTYGSVRKLVELARPEKKNLSIAVGLCYWGWEGGLFFGWTVWRMMGCGV
ncbi:hypothetical protein M231_06876 [Tremella mesenterica]|uniref:Uncharacterized protein n=1 Tax=Tremella mesenterica TaxID=5217 RepID=A0A4V1M373_TREME|nr:hypothetical protein M231_06876 [Tremella mesenterica]